MAEQAGADCCSVSRQPAVYESATPQLANAAVQGSLPAAERHQIEQCLIAAGTFVMGDHAGEGYVADGEAPQHEVYLDAFHIDATTVTNAQFARFFADTGYVTDAERFGNSAVFHLLVEAETQDIVGQLPGMPWWVSVRGAQWRHPGGPMSNIDHLLDHPVVHISHNDALAYCIWAGRRLPTEAEWEKAARAGLSGTSYPWGNDPIDGSDGVYRANVWQGTFHTHNTAADGFIGTAPVRSFWPNEAGLWQMVGNVWEWCADGFDPQYYRYSEHDNPQGAKNASEKVLRGGSYLCHESYCNRYRNSARSHNTPDSSMGNAGFRTVKDHA